MDSPEPDPEAIRARQRARRERQDTMQEDLDRDTDSLMRMFGNRAAFSGGSLRSPLRRE